MLKQKERLDEMVSKVLLLGPGESGKSTVFRQMVIHFGKGLAQADRDGMIPLVRDNIINQILMLAVQGPLVVEGLALTEQSQIILKSLLAETHPDLREKETQDSVNTLWNDPAMQILVNEHLSEFQVQDSLGYFVGRIGEIGRRDYSPTDEDLIRVRVRTTGIVQASFEMDKHVFNIVDVGGQRSERKKWALQFDNVKAVLFIVAASEYDQTVWEYQDKNRMHESLEIFEESLRHRSFTDCTFILFLNKADLFEKKITNISLSACFPDWDSSKDKDVEAAWKFLSQKFIDIASVSTLSLTLGLNSDRYMPR